jgi:hypothetical protein
MGEGAGVICAKCHRPLKHAPVNGLGPKCAIKARALPPGGRDLFGFDIEAAEKAARVEIEQLVHVMAAEASSALRQAARRALERLCAR